MGIQSLLEKALLKWSNSLAEMVTLLTTPIDQFRGGQIWNVIVNVNGAMQAIGTSVLIICFLIGVINTTSTIAETKRVEYAVKVFFRFIFAEIALTQGLNIMLYIIGIAQSLVARIMSESGFSGLNSNMQLTQDIIDALADLGVLDSILCWLIALLSYLIITVISFIILLTIYGRFFKLYIYTALSPIPLATFGGQPTSSVGKGFLKSYIGVCFEATIIVLACVIFSAFATSTPTVTSTEANVMIMEYMTDLIFNMLILVGIVKASDRLVREMMGI